MRATEERGQRRILAVLFVGVLMAALDIAIVGPALPSIQKTFGIGSRALAWVFNIYVLFNLIGTPVMAKLSDRFGRRRIYVADVCLFATGSLVVAAAPSFTVMLVGRAVQALGAGGIFPVASAVVGDVFPPETRGGALGIIGAVFGLAFLVGPVLGGLLLQLSWHWLFLVNLPVALWLVWQSLRHLPASRPESPRDFDWKGIATLSLALGSLAFAVGGLDGIYPLSSLLSLRVLPFALASLALAALFLRVERHAGDPVLQPRLLASPQVRRVSLFAAGAGLAEAAVVFLPALAVAALGVSGSTASFLVLPLVLALAVGSPVSGRLLDRLGSRTVIMAGILLSAAGLVFLGLGASELPVFVIAGITTGLGLSALLGAPLRYILLNEAGEGERAASQALLTIFLSVGQLLGGALVGAVAASAVGASGYQRALMAIGTLTLLLFLAATGLKRKNRERHFAGGKQEHAL